MVDNPFPVMHGSMWKEPQTLKECENTDCDICAYNGRRLDTFSLFGVEFCPHRDVLSWFEEALK